VCTTRRLQVQCIVASATVSTRPITANNMPSCTLDVCCVPPPSIAAGLLHENATGLNGKLMAG
jgi:hypothetical protein